MPHLLDIPADKIDVIKSLCGHLDIPFKAVGDGDMVEVSLKRIKEETARVFGITVEAMTSKSQDHDLVRARWVCFVMAYAHLDMSNKAIGLHFGGRDHSTVIYGKEQVEILIRTTPRFRHRAISVERLLFPEVPSGFEALA